METIRSKLSVARVERTTSGQQEAKQISSQKRKWDRSIAQPKESGVEEHEAGIS